MTLLTSRQNPKIKQIRSLQQRKQRSTLGLYVVEGIRHVGEAVEAGAEIEYALFSSDILESDFAYQIITRLENNGTPVFTTPGDIFQDLAGKEHPAGLMAVVRQQNTAINQLNKDNFSWGVVVESPQDPGNLGTILRTLDSAGAEGLIVVGGGVDIYHPTAVRASMGTLFWQRVVSVSLDDFLSWQEDQGYQLYGTSSKGQVGAGEVDYQKPALLVLGSERAGLSSGLRAACQQVICLPMHGRSTSLNLSVAAGILLYSMEETLLSTN